MKSPTWFEAKQIIDNWIGFYNFGHAAMFTDKPKVLVTRFFSQLLNGFLVVASKKNANNYSGQPERYSDLN
jgi:hypothetical protein